MTKLILKIFFIIQSIGISVLLIFGMWKCNIFEFSVTENVILTVWIGASILSIIAYYAVSLYKKLRQEEN